MSKEKIAPPEVTVAHESKNTNIPAISNDPTPPAVLLFGRYLGLLKGDPTKVWNYNNLELIRCQPGVIL